MKYLEKIYQNDKNQIYLSHDGCLKLDMNYLYVYKNDKNKIEQLISDEFPFMEFFQYKGFIFVKEHKKIPLLPSSILNIFKTNIKNLNNQFTNKKYDIVLKFTGYKSCSPKINNNIYFGFSYDEFMNISDNDVKKMYNEFYKSQTLKNISEWFEYICENCPYEINYANEIKQEDFKKNISKNDVMIEYDIRHPKEIELIKKVEQIFDDNNSMIILFNDFHNTLDKITDIISKRDDITAYRDKNKLTIKYSDLLKLNLTWTIENFY